MSSENSSPLIFTSTPKQGVKDTTVLREKKWNNIMVNDTSFNEEKVIIRTDKFKSKENRRRHPIVKSQYARKSSDPAEKRRIQAIEAMQIAEQRRRRMSSDEEEKLAENMENLKVAGHEFLPDGRIKLTRQQLITRNMKRKRIEQQLREQEKRKQSKQASSKKKVTFKEPIAVISRPKSEKRPLQPIRKLGVRVQPIATSTSTAPVMEEKQPKNDDKRSAAIPAAKQQEEKQKKKAQPDDEQPQQKKEDEKKQATIRYTKDELRELNPYGFYFM